MPHKMLEAVVRLLSLLKDKKSLRKYKIPQAFLSFLLNMLKYAIIELENWIKPKGIPFLYIYI